MPRQEYVQRLNSLQDELLLIGSMVDKAIQRAITGLKDRDAVVAQQVIEDDDKIDTAQIELEDRAIDLMATQQPMASDLRRLVSTIHVAEELERVGDYAEGIAKITLLMGTDPPVKPLIDIPRMAELARDMLRTSLDALVNRDVEMATQAWQRDDEVDALYEQVYRELLTYMVEDPRTIERTTYLIWVAHNLERIADRATNIAERVIYISTGERPVQDELWDKRLGQHRGDSNGGTRRDYPPAG